jgi:hypothetical protein
VSILPFYYLATYFKILIEIGKPSFSWKLVKTFKGYSITNYGTNEKGDLQNNPKLDDDASRELKPAPRNQKPPPPRYKTPCHVLHHDDLLNCAPEILTPDTPNLLALYIAIVIEARISRVY